MIDTEFQKLKQLGVTEETVEQYQVLCLPENLNSVSSPEDLFDSDESPDISKLLRAAGVACANSYDLGLPAKPLHRRGAELWLGLYLVIDKLVLPLFVNLLVKFIGPTKQIEAGGQRKPQSTGELPVAHLELRIKDGFSYTRLKFDGPARELVGVLRALVPPADSEKQDE